MQTSITVREIRLGEEKAVQMIGQRAFNGMEALLVPKPKPRAALVAERDGVVVGAVLYKFFQAGKHKVGYIDYGFVDPDYHGQGVGNVLYKAAIDFLWSQGCDAVTALVKDDNVGSWSLLMKNGLNRVSLPSLVRQFGLSGALAHYFSNPFCMGVGMDYYVALREGPCPSGKGDSTKQVGAYFLANAIFLVAIGLAGRENLLATAAVYLFLLAGGVIFSYLGTRFSQRDWAFRHCNGGGAIGAFLIISRGLFPMVGRWYPTKYESSPEFRRDMGLSALTEWLFLLFSTALAILFSGQHVAMRILMQLGTSLLIFRMIPVYPFESYGSLRVFKWNKWIYGLMAVCSLVVVILAFGSN